MRKARGLASRDGSPGLNTTITQEGDTLDLVCWRHYGRTSNRLVEQVLEANRGLAEYGPQLPMGLTVDLPAPAQAAAARPVTVQLWD